MDSLIDYLNATKEKLGIKSWRQFAFKLGISQAAMDKYVNGLGSPTDEVCNRIAHLAGDRPEVVIALAHKSKAKGEMVKVWSKIFKAVSAASFMLIFILHIVYYVKSFFSKKPRTLTANPV